MLFCNNDKILENENIHLLSYGQPLAKIYTFNKTTSVFKNMYNKNNVHGHQNMRRKQPTVTLLMQRHQEYQAKCIHIP